MSKRGPSHQEQMMAAVGAIARLWLARGTTIYPGPFVQSLSALIREAYFVEHGEYPEPMPNPPGPGLN